MEVYNLAYFVNRNCNTLQLYKCDDSDTDVLNELKKEPLSTPLICLPFPNLRMFEETDIDKSSIEKINQAVDIQNSILTAIEYLNIILTLVFYNNSVKLIKSNLGKTSNIKTWHYTVIK